MQQGICLQVLLLEARIGGCGRFLGVAAALGELRDLWVRSMLSCPHLNCTSQILLLPTTGNSIDWTLYAYGMVLPFRTCGKFERVYTWLTS